MPDISDDLIPATPRKPDWERAMLEKVAMASIREQQANRRWKTFVRMAWLLFFAVLAWMFFQRGAPDAAKMTSPHTAVIEIRGDIADGADSSAANIVPAVKRAFEDAGSRAVVLSRSGPTHTAKSSGSLMPGGRVSPSFSPPRRRPPKQAHNRDKM